MIHLAFCFLDAKAGFFHPPFFMAHAGLAIRAAADLAVDQNTTLGRHPADFHLYRVGEFDDANGRFTATTPENLGPLTQFLPAPVAQLRLAGE